jgi:TatD DNase family protein
MFIDTHAHLDFPEIRPQLNAVLSNARLANVEVIITIGIDEVTNRNALEIAGEHEEVYAALGWHPHEAASADDRLEETLQNWSKHQKVVAVGEIGLDYYRDYSPREKQRQVFARMISVAADLDLPIIVHCREAFEDTLDILRRESTDQTRGVFHCFSGDQAELHQVLDLGFFVSYTGNITYRNTRLQATVEATPLDRLLLETDCPFLTPHPHRGKRNEPAYIPIIAAKLAEIKGLDIEEIARLTSANAYCLFGLGSAS